MAQKGFLMALDAGGGGGHCLLVEVETGKSTRAFRPWTHPVAPGTGGMGCDLDLQSIWKALVSAAQEAMERSGARAEEVLGIAATSMRLTTIVLDRTGKPLLATPNRDGRAFAEAVQLAERGPSLYARTGHWPAPVFAAPRLQWLAANRPDAWRSAAKLLSLSDWVAFRLCGEMASEPSQAGESLLFDVARREWAWDFIDELGFPRAIFPAVCQSGERLGALTAEAAAALGLREGTPVAAGGGDTQCGLLGAGAVAPGHAALIAGTTAPIEVVLDRPVFDAQQRLWTGCHVIPGLWVLESNAGPMGEVLAWLASILYADGAQAPAMFLAEAAQSPVGAAGIFSTLGGEIMNARELRLPLGEIALSHMSTARDPQRRSHLARAVVEGMAYAVLANLEQLREVAGVEIRSLDVAGGMSRSETFAQIVSDVTNLPVEVGPTGEATALGAALCAGVAAGVFESLAAAAQKLVRPARKLAPQKEHAAKYRELYAAWRDFRAALGPANAVATQAALPALLQSMAEAAAERGVTIRPRILITADMDEESLAAFRDLGDVEYASFRQHLRVLSGPMLAEALRGVHVLVTEVDVVDAEALQKLPDLRVIASCRGEAVNIDVAACTAFGIPVLHAPGRNAEAVADLTIAFLLMLARKLPEATAFLRQPGIEAGDIGRMGQAFTTLQGRELWRKTVGLVGMGSVGRAVARRLRAFGAHVIAYDPFLRDEQILAGGAEPVGLEELLARSDFVSLHAAVSETSKGLIGARELAQMKRGAFLVNTARAALVDEDALAEALQSKHLAGAALDVFSAEPPGSDHPLLALDNVIATPHIGGNTVEVAAHQGRIVAKDLGRLLRGARPRHALNPEVLEGFDWSRPRRQPDAEQIRALSARPRPGVSDLYREPPAARPKAKPAPHPETAAPAAPATAAAQEVAERMRRIVERFTQRIAADATVRAASADKEVTLHFAVSDLSLGFYISLRGGEVAAATGDPPGRADVNLKMRADVLDGMFTGRINPMQAATTGKLSFAGDTLKAMTLQVLQADLSRLYREARAEVGDPGDLSLLSPETATRAPSPAPIAAGEGDVRAELVQIVNELYAAQLITATGGNVSARIPGREGEIWITPSQLFKGDLRPEILVAINLEGQPLDPESPSPSSERLMHCAIYRARPDANAVIHAHAPYATVLANTGLPFLPISTEAAFFGNIPRVPFVMPGTEELARAVGEAARENWAVLLQNHGLIVGGRSLRRAADMVEIIERSAQILVTCYALGKQPSTLPEELVRALQQMGDLVA